MASGPLTPGDVLDGRWRVDARVGQGSMATVYRGRDLRQARTVAIKVLSGESASKPRTVTRFEREAQVLASLRHPSLVPVYASGRHGALPYLVMAFLDGASLAEALPLVGGRFPLADAVAILQAAGSALTYLHHHGLVHRDVKPHNIFASPGPQVTLLDLGVVRDLHHPGLTRPGAMVGTPYYMSPEQTLGAEDLDTRADVYSLAAVAFELVTGRPPFLGDSNPVVLAAHRTETVPDAGRLAPVPSAAARALQRGLAKEREARFQSVADLLQALSAAVEGPRPSLLKALAFLDEPGPRPEERTRLLTLPGVKLGLASPPDEWTEDTQTEVAVQGEDTAAHVLPALGEGRLRVALMSAGKQAVGRVLLDGKDAGTTPTTATVSAGWHAVHVELGRFRETRNVEVPAGGTVLVRFDA